MRDLISREEAVAYIKSTYCTGCNNHNGVRCRACEIDDDISALEDVPAVDAEYVRHGRWADIKGAIRCSECQNTPLYDYYGNQVFTKRCHVCGAKMDGDKDAAD